MWKVFSTLVLLASASAALAQVPAPVVPEQIIYRHWPEQFVQWIGPELPYSMIELYVDPAVGSSPLYDAVLTERATGKRVHYTNQPQMLEIDKRGGSDAYLTAMQLDRPDHAAPGAAYLLRFVTHDQQPVSWQFIQGSDISERGGGSSPAAPTPPMLLFRQRSAVAGEGSALKVGDKVSVADVWTEISQPPYFVAYRGALSENVEIAVFAGGKQEWTTLSAPQTLSAGASWTLRSAEGVGRTLKVKSLNGSQAILLDHDEHFPHRIVTLDAEWSNGVWTIQKMHYAAADGDDPNLGLTLAFTPGIHAQAGEAKFEVLADGKTRIASGTVHAETDVVRWEFKDPQWLRGKPAVVGSTGVIESGAVAQSASR